MLVFDNTLLSDFLDGKDAARAFLEEYEAEEWALPAIVLNEAYLGSIHGYIDGSPAVIRQAVTTSMDVLPVTEQTASEAAAMQEQLVEQGIPAEHPDALIAASAREHGGVFATADKHFWKDEVQEIVDVAKYDPF